MCTTLLHARLAFVPTKDRVTCLLVHTQFRPILGVLVGSLVVLSASALAEAPAHKRPTPALLAKAARTDQATFAATASTLPVPSAPPVPPLPTRFAAPSSDPAGLAARRIARRVQRFTNFRAQIAGAVWSEDPSATWSIRRQSRCLRELERRGVPHHLVTRELTTPVATLVEVDGSIDGVSYVSAHAQPRPIEVSCELATRLAPLSRLLRAHGVRSVLVNSSYREQPYTSFHTFGLALDIAGFKTAREPLSVAAHFEPTPDAYTCGAEPKTLQGKALLSIACAIAQSRLFSSVLTPNYNEGHRDHFHLDARPDDPRFFVR